MRRDKLAVGDEALSEQFGELVQSFQRALPPHADRASFDALMAEARAQGLDWVKGIAYVAAKRRPARAVLPQSLPRDRAVGDGNK